MADYPMRCKLCGSRPEYLIKRCEGEPWHTYVELGCKSHRHMRVVASNVENATYLWNNTCARQA